MPGNTVPSSPPARRTRGATRPLPAIAGNDLLAVGPTGGDRAQALPPGPPRHDALARAGAQQALSARSVLPSSSGGNLDGHSPRIISVRVSSPSLGHSTGPVDAISSHHARRASGGTRLRATAPRDDGGDGPGGDSLPLSTADDGMDTLILAQVEATNAGTQQALLHSDENDIVGGSLATGSPGGGDLSQADDDEKGPSNDGRVAPSARENAGTMPPSSGCPGHEPVAVTQEIGGVYALRALVQQAIVTLLRTLFTDEATSDKSIRVFLGVARFLLAFSHLVGILSMSASSNFFASLQKAFEKPATVKYFLEITFQSGYQGLHVGVALLTPR